MIVGVLQLFRALLQTGRSRPKTNQRRGQIKVMQLDQP